MSEEPAWKIWNEVAVNGRTVAEATVLRRADLEDVGPLKRRVGKLAGCFDAGDIEQGEEGLEGLLLLNGRRGGGESWRLWDGLSKRYGSILSSVCLYLSILVQLSLNERDIPLSGA